MKKLLLLSLLLIAFCSYGQTQETVVKKKGVNILIVDEQGTPDPGGCPKCLGPVPIVVDPVTGVMTVTYSDGSTYVSPPLKGPKGDKGDTGAQGPAGPQGIQGPPGSGGGGGNSKQFYKEYNAYDFGVKGDGVTDDRAALQNMINAAIANHGKWVIPPPANFYRINGTLFIGNGSPSQIWCHGEMYGAKRGSGIVYMGPSNQPAIVVIGMKAGIIEGIKAKVGDGISGVDVMRITTQGSANSTASFTLENIELEVNGGVNNRGMVFGTNSGNGDISQILVRNCTSWGNDDGIFQSGQVGFVNEGGNTLELTWISGGTVFLETGFRVDRGGAMDFLGAGGSQCKQFFWFRGANNFNIIGGRYESCPGCKFMTVDGSSNHPTVNIVGPVLGNMQPSDGYVITFDSPGTLIMDGIRMERDPGTPLFTGPVIKLGGSGGAFFARGGMVGSSHAELTNNGAGWRQIIQNVRQTLQSGESTGWFNNK